MKIIEGMKQIKELQRKASDLRSKVKAHCADMDFENPIYPDQNAKIKEWIQAHSDLLKEILKLRYQIQKTNISTQVDIQLNGKAVTKSIAEWIQRRRDLAGEELQMWSALSDRGLKDGQFQESSGTFRDVKIRRYYDPEVRDQKKDLFASEPGLIDGRLEVVNAITDLVE